eukprot:c8090_g1_i1.p1 GENE.c8090_g1_i1~~c8090_g1_i1.p1  ORF type:complete len:521 (+),score=132.34 c8090_g1_i1:117-1565(+)
MDTVFPLAGTTTTTTISMEFPKYGSLEMQLLPAFESGPQTKNAKLLSQPAQLTDLTESLSAPLNKRLVVNDYNNNLILNNNTKNSRVFSTSTSSCASLVVSSPQPCSYDPKLIPAASSVLTRKSKLKKGRVGVIFADMVKASTPAPRILSIVLDSGTNLQTLVKQPNKNLSMWCSISSLGSPHEYSIIVGPDDKMVWRWTSFLQLACYNTHDIVTVRVYNSDSHDCINLVHRFSLPTEDVHNNRITRKRIQVSSETHFDLSLRWTLKRAPTWHSGAIREVVARLPSSSQGLQVPSPTTQQSDTADPDAVPDSDHDQTEPADPDTGRSKHKSSKKHRDSSSRHHSKHSSSSSKTDQPKRLRRTSTQAGTTADAAKVLVTTDSLTTITLIPPDHPSPADEPTASSSNTKKGSNPNVDIRRVRSAEELHGSSTAKPTTAIATSSTMTPVLEHQTSASRLLSPWSWSFKRPQSFSAKTTQPRIIWG